MCIGYEAVAVVLPHVGSHIIFVPLYIFYNHFKIECSLIEYPSYFNISIHMKNNFNSPCR